jgi:hypothetical protein
LRLERLRRGLSGPHATKLVAFALWLALVVLYQTNGSVVEEGDATPSLNLPIAILKHRSLSFTPDDFPEMFHWRSLRPLPRTDDFYVRRWPDFIGRRTAQEWRDAGRLVFRAPRYHLVQSPRTGLYVSTFGPVPGVTFLPLSAFLLLLDPTFGDEPLLQLSAAKLHGSMLVAGSAVILFLIALGYTTRWRALFTAACYALGTCAWAVSSQHIWQQTANAFFLCLGCLFFLRGPDSRKLVAASGAAFGAALACRSTSLLLLLAVAIYLAVWHKKSVYAFVAATVPVPAALGVYNWYYFGNPFSLGQEIVGHTMAMEKTGSPELWQTPLYEGALGLLASPSRGLLIFSPFLVFAAFGIFRIWRDARFRAFRPLTIATLAIMAVQCKWFDWWGGWTYGYRPWLDVVPLLTLFLLPVIERLGKRVVLTAAFSVTLAWSVFVQIVGAFAYDKMWNERVLYVTRMPLVADPILHFTEAEARKMAQADGGEYLGPTLCNIDKTYCRYRLWSWSDSIVLYYIENFERSRKTRYATAWNKLSIKFLRPRRG